MSLIAFAEPIRSAISDRLTARLACAFSAILIVGLGLAVLGWLIAASGLVPQVPARNPFGIGLREVPGFSGFGGVLLALQGQFYLALTGALQTLKSDGGAVFSLATVGFLYGVFHAAGPGHGKGVIMGYLFSNNYSLWSGLVSGLCLSFSSAILQATVAVSLVGILGVALQATAVSISATAHAIEVASFCAIAAVGAFLLWRKSGELVNALWDWRGSEHAAANAFPQGGKVRGARQWRDFAGVVAAAGMRPCSGAIVLLVFALSQGLFLAGVLGAFAMAVGTAITTGTLAALAVSIKAIATRLATGASPIAVAGLSGLELLAAAFVMSLGILLLTGDWAASFSYILD